MGVGKSTVGNILKGKLKRSVLLEGDNCWNYEKDKDSEQAKKSVLITIITKLNDYIKSDYYESIIFCWVMHRQSIIDSILNQLDLTDCKLINVSLICSEIELIKRLSLDVSKGIRDKAIFQRSVERLPLYKYINTIQLDISDKTPIDVVNELIKIEKNI